MKKLNPVKISIGIPIHNEEANIGNLLNDLMNQEQSSFNIEEIIIYLDGCTDNSIGKIKEIKSSKIKIINRQTQKGIAQGLNSIFSISDGDILVVFNADIRIKDKKFIQKIINPIIKKGADLTSCPICEIESKTLIQKILKEGMLWKEITFSNTNDGDNVYTCHGPARAFSKIFYKKMKLKFSYGEDMYSYLFSAQSGNKYHYVKNTHIYYQSPKTFSDHFKQSQRFRISIKIMSDIFGEEFIQNNFKINTSKGLKTFIKRLSTNPVYLILYLLLNVFISLGLSISKSNQNYQTWPTVKSSKFTINT